MSYQMAFFASSSIEKINEAILAEKVSYPAYVFIRSEDEKTGQLGFVDKGNVLKLISGEGKKQVVNVESLPNVSECDKEVLYICDGIVYSFDGAKLNPAYKDHTSDIESLDSRISAIETKNTDLESQVKTLTETVESLEVASGLTFVELE